MPIVDKYDPNNWYNTIPARKPNPEVPDRTTFDPDKLRDNEIVLANGKVLAKIPQISGRIFAKPPDENHSDTYIEFIADRWYIPEKKQMRNKKIIIGTDASFFYPGMMLINEHYHKYFDTEGNLINDLLEIRRQEEQQKRAEQQKEQQIEKTKEIPKILPEKQVQKKTKEPKKAQGDDRTVEEIRESLLKKEKLLEERLEEAERCRQAYEEAKEEYENAEQIRRIEFQEEEQEHLHLLSYILDSYISTVREQAKRRPDKLMSLNQIRTINEILTELQEIFADCETEEYLHLAPEPQEDDKDCPGTTYGEMDLLLSAWRWTLNAGVYNRLSCKRNRKTTT